MTGPPGVERVEDPAAERWGRWALWIVLVVSWVVAVVYMWDAMTTVPGGDRLQESRLVEIPSPRTFFTAAIFSGMELAVALVALWPRWPDFYPARLGATALGLLTWFVSTTPMGLSRMDWVHRRWLAFMIVAAAVGLVLLIVYRGLRWATRRATGN